MKVCVDITTSDDDRLPVVMLKCGTHTEELELPYVPLNDNWAVVEAVEETLDLPSGALHDAEIHDLRWR